MPQLCTIIISCFNKTDYVAQTVESALAQTYEQVEVIAIDDGSRDSSVSVLKRYDRHITCVVKENGGQISTMNLGFALARGDIIFFLDGDDVLLPDTVARVVAMWRSNFSKVHFRLQKIRDDGTLLAGALLPPYRELPSGDLRPQLDKFGFYSSPPTSGNAFSRSYLEQIMPLPETRGSETPLIGIAPLFGEIGALGEVGGYWRQSANNLSSGDLSLLEREISYCEDYVTLANVIAAREGHVHRIPSRWPYYLKRRVILAKFDVGNRKRSMVLPVVLIYLQCVIRWPEYNLAVRSKFILWALAMLLLPAKVLRAVPGIAGPGLLPTRAATVDFPPDISCSS